MKFALVSDDFCTITGKTGRARKFLVYEATQDIIPTLVEKLEVPQTQPTFHDLHDDDITPHPLVYITSQTDPLEANHGVIQGNIPTLAPTPHGEDGRCLNH